jgi:hypothetical protein
MALEVAGGEDGGPAFDVVAHGSPFRVAEVLGKSEVYTLVYSKPARSMGTFLPRKFSTIRRLTRGTTSRGDLAADSIASAVTAGRKQ